MIKPKKYDRCSCSHTRHMHNEKGVCRKILRFRIKNNNHVNVIYCDCKRFRIKR